MTRISIILPAYNAESTLRKTIEDILLQTYSDYELIIVDDGSTDNTAAICDDYMSNDSKIIVIHQKNGGLSNARNNGVNAAGGELITFIDSDDRIDKKYLELLINAYEKTGATFISGQVDRIQENVEYIAPVYNNGDVLVVSQKKALQLLGLGEIPVGSWCKLAKKEQCLKNPFLEGKYYEDLSNTYKMIMENELIALVKAPIYHYTMRGGSITGRRTTTKKQCLDYYEAINLCEGTIVKKFPDIKSDVDVLKIRDCLSLFLSINRCSNIDKELLDIKSDIYCWIRKNWISVVRNNNTPLELKLRVLLFSMSTKLYSFLYYIAAYFKGKNFR